MAITKRQIGAMVSKILTEAVPSSMTGWNQCSFIVIRAIDRIRRGRLQHLYSKEEGVGVGKERGMESNERCKDEKWGRGGGVDGEVGTGRGRCGNKGAKLNTAKKRLDRARDREGNKRRIME